MTSLVNSDGRWHVLSGRATDPTPFEGSSDQTETTSNSQNKLTAASPKVTERRLAATVEGVNQTMSHWEQDGGLISELFLAGTLLIAAMMIIVSLVLE